jgi:hypothetical protein
MSVHASQSTCEDGSAAALMPRPEQPAPAATASTFPRPAAALVEPCIRHAPAAFPEPPGAFTAFCEQQLAALAQRAFGPPCGQSFPGFAACGQTPEEFAAFAQRALHAAAIAGVHFAAIAALHVAGSAPALAPTGRSAAKMGIAQDPRAVTASAAMRSREAFISHLRCRGAEPRVGAA